MKDRITLSRRDSQRIAELLDYLADYLDTERDLRHLENPTLYTDEERKEVRDDLESARGFSAYLKTESRKPDHGATQ